MKEVLAKDKHTIPVTWDSNKGSNSNWGTGVKIMKTAKSSFTQAEQTANIMKHIISSEGT